MNNRQLMLEYSRRMQVLLPKPLDLREFEDECRYSCPMTDDTRNKFAIFLNEFLNKSIIEEVESVPQFCTQFQILNTIRSIEKNVACAGLKQVKNVKILQATYSSIRRSLILYLLEKKAKSLGYTG